LRRSDGALPQGAKGATLPGGEGRPQGGGRRRKGAPSRGTEPEVEGNLAGAGPTLGARDAGLLRRPRPRTPPHPPPGDRAPRRTDPSSQYIEPAPARVLR